MGQGGAAWIWFFASSILSVVIACGVGVINKAFTEISDFFWNPWQARVALCMKEYEL